VSKDRLTTQEFIAYSHIPERTLRRKIQTRELVPIKEGKNLYFHYLQLPTEEIKENFLRDRHLKKDHCDEKKQDVKPWARKIADKRMALVLEYCAAAKDIPPKKLTDFKRIFSKSRSVSYRTLENYIKAYQGGGYHALIPNWHNGEQNQIIKKELAKFIEDTFLVPYGPPIKEVYEKLCEKFCSKFDGLPSYRTVVNYIATKWTKSQQLIIRNKEAWDRIYSPYVRRDWDACELNEVWVADSKQIDVACLYRKRAIFPWLVAILEAKSRKYVGWILVPTPNALAIGQAIGYSLSQVGPSKTFYCDLGKDYKSGYVTGGKEKITKENPLADIEDIRLPGILGEIGTETFFAAPYNGREKLIEPSFGVFTDRSVPLPGYRGHNTKTRPKKLAQEIKSGNLLTFEELSAKIDELIRARNARPHSTTKKPPDSYWEGYQAVIPSQHFLDYLLMDVHICKVKDSSVLVKGLLYRHDELFKLSGEKVEVRRDPKNIRRAVIIYKDQVFCSAKLEMVDHYRSDITLENVKTCARIRKKIGEYRKFILKHEDVIEDPLRVACELEKEEKTRTRDIRPAQSKVKSIHKRERLARNVSKALQQEECEEYQEVMAVAAGGGNFFERYLDALPPPHKEKPINFERLLGEPLNYNPNFREF